jgi:aryl-alcohol dehydrogenase-like predicted oxidoreductase
MNFGWHTSEKDSFTIMDTALEEGINFFDTADVYGWAVEKGLTEEIVGNWIAQGGGRRESIVLATKVYNPVDRKNTRPEPNRDGRNLSAMKIIRHCEDSLKRLKTDRIDIYQMHHVDRDCPWEEVWQAMDTLVRQGKIIYAASSNFAGWDIATANQEAWKRGLNGLVSEQSIYNLNNRTVELEVIPACRHYGMGLIPWSPLDGGLLSGVLQKQKEGRRSSDGYAEKVKKYHNQLTDYEKLCSDFGKPPAQVALAWLLHNPVVTAPIIGPRILEHLQGAVEAASVELSEDLLNRLDEIWPGPGGEAPKAYAW